MKNVIVTGASGNMGRAIVKKFLLEGYYVTGTVVPNDPTPLDIDNARFEKAIVDLGNEESATLFVASVIQKHGSVDAAVLTVGGFAMGKVADTTLQEISRQIKLNFETSYTVARPVFAHMLKQQ